MGRCWVMCALVLLTTCKKSGPEPLRPNEEQQLEASLLRDVHSDEGRVCARPVLRGKPAMGSASSDILALLERKGPFLACFDFAASKDGAAVISALLERAPPADQRLSRCRERS